LAVVSEGWCGRAHIAEFVSFLLATPGYRTFKSVTPTAWVNSAALIFTNARDELRQRGGARAKAPELHLQATRWHTLAGQAEQEVMYLGSMSVAHQFRDGMQVRVK
jgi:hypothetical protein